MYRDVCDCRKPATRGAAISFSITAGYAKEKIVSILAGVELMGVARTYDTRIYIFPSWLYWIVVGLIAGWLAGHLMRGRGFGCFGDTILGLIGAVVGGWIFMRLGIATYGFIGSLAAATVGALLLVGIAHLFSSHD
jgi:uncharacterized membrane protein YeaQ/YmgE (transglycosylase-associated protein family)